MLKATRSFLFSFFILLWLAPLEPAKAGSFQCLSSLDQEFSHKLQPAQYATLVALPPVNNMGRDFAESFGNFLSQHEASPQNMMSLATSLFSTRLALAQKHKTKFAEQMNHEIWKNRLSGQSNLRIWSFGIRGHLRGESVYVFFKSANLERYPHTLETVERSQFSRDVGQGLVTIPTILFPYSVGDLKINDFKIYILDKDTYFIEHASDKNVPLAVQRLEFLWMELFNSSKPLDKKLQILSEWEWLWFWSNPFGRAGASIGSSLSLLLQEQLIKENSFFTLPSEFKATDLEAISRSLTDYVQFRTSQLLKRVNHQTEANRSDSKGYSF